MKRRTAFAAPLVVIVSCQRPIEPPPVEPPPAEPSPAPPDEPSPVPPKRLVATLEPLDHRAAVAITVRPAEPNPCRDVDAPGTCNPPPPDYPRPAPPKRESPELPLAGDERVVALHVEGDGTRVRLERRHRTDRDWRATFVTRDGVEIPNTTCAIVDWNDELCDCIVQRAPADLVDRDGDAYDVRVSPSAELLARAEAERDNWLPDGALHAHVIDATDTRVVSGVGSQAGVTPSWHARLRRGGKIVRDATCTITRVERRTTTCEVRARVDADEMELDPP